MYPVLFLHQIWWFCVRLCSYIGCDGSISGSVSASDVMVLYPVLFLTWMWRFCFWFSFCRMWWFCIRFSSCLFSSTKWFCILFSSSIGCDGYIRFSSYTGCVGSVFGSYLQDDSLSNSLPAPDVMILFPVIFLLWVWWLWIRLKILVLYNGCDSSVSGSYLQDDFVSNSLPAPDALILNPAFFCRMTIYLIILLHRL
jgi:hypothetical protein